MTDPVAEALALWGLEGAAYHLVAGRENRVFRVETPRGMAALRVRRPGYRSDAELRSELDWMDAMRRAGLSVPQPIASRSGVLLERVGDFRVDLLDWLPGQPMGEGRGPLALTDAPGVFSRLGEEMARLHAACDGWLPPDGFARVKWDAEGLIGETPLWGRFWENPTLSQEQQVFFLRFRDEARAELAHVGSALDQGLIHADLVRENVLIEGDRLHLIDFDDGGWGFRLFDIATALLKHRHELGFADLKVALLAGYRTHLTLDDRQLGLFLALRAVTYLGWIVPRLSEEGGAQRNARFIADAEVMCRRWLDRGE
ncbi:MAG: phosphotransferase [Rhodobacteraceae bacterium]|nr:phosphotransferase [Paracoccaceae bacterium]